MNIKRSIYSQLQEWKEETKGTKALLIEGARRIGKSTVAEKFGKNEYKSYVVIDFNDASETIKNAFDNYLNDLDTFFMLISVEYNVTLHNRDSLIIFDEIQMFPKARQAIKKLVKDGRFDYIETGSLISIRENVKDITIPSEERSIKMYPLSFVEFCFALGKAEMINYIKTCFENKQALERKMHEKAMLLFRQYMIVGGMPQSVVSYIESNYNFNKSDIEKRDILNLYRQDIMKIDSKYRSKVLSIFDQIPAFLSKGEKKVNLSKIEGGTFNNYHDSFFWLNDSKICNQCFNCSDPNTTLSLNEDRTYIKCYMGDTGLLLSHAFNENQIEKNDLFKKLLNEELNINEGMLYENLISQMLVFNGYKLFFYNKYNKVKKRNDIEIDFIITSNNSLEFKICPIEIKSGKRYTINSLNKFNDVFNERIDSLIVIHPKNLVNEGNTLRIPPYMTFCL